MASWLSSSGECMTNLPGPMHLIGENVGWEKSKMRSVRGDLTCRYGWISRGGKEMER